MNKQQLFLGLAVVTTAGILLSGCISQSPTTSTEEQNPAMTTQKQGDTTMSGQLIQLGEKYYLQRTGESQQEVDSYSVDLASYVGQTVTITGQFSGDTLFAGKIETQQ
ncbi:hypothetical protein H3C70_03470 [Patescibacteria group bacterium]|nr:hypothetical protein [Patescibacteria group bacterium]